VSSRRKAREAVLKALYMSESRGMTVDEAFAEMASCDAEIAGFEDSDEKWWLMPFALSLDEDGKTYALSLARMIERNSETLNGYIIPVLHNWDFKRVSRIDRIILWMALTEMLYLFDVPVSVAINEAIELAKKYSSHKSPSFVNGILDTAAANMKER